jgi:AraC-like DNA-binding protein
MELKKSSNNGSCYDDGCENERTKYPELIIRALALIHKNYAQLYGIEELSEELMVSKCHLVRAFSSAVGKSPGKYLTAVRLAASKNLLCGKDYNVEVVATLCGFSGANYFCRVFRQETGISPLAYRKKMSPVALDTETTEMEKRIFL